MCPFNHSDDIERIWLFGLQVECLKLFECMVHKSNFQPTMSKTEFLLSIKMSGTRHT